MGQQVNVYRKLKLFPGAVIEGSWAGQFDRFGRTYYVNVVTGSATNDGLSWNSPVNTVGAAVTLAEAWRDTQTANNQYVRCTIVVQGTATDNTAVAVSDCSYNDFIGLGACPLGDGTGIACISGANAADAWSATATMRGNTWYNLQFDASGTSYCAFDATNVLRCRFEECSFMGDSAENEALVAGIRATGAFDGNTVRNCFIGTNWALPTTGMAFGGSLSNTTIQDCTILAATYGINISTDGLTVGGVIKDCQILAATKGIVSSSAQTMLWIVGNYISSADAISITAGGTTTGEHMCLGNIVNNAGTIVSGLGETASG